MPAFETMDRRDDAVLWVRTGSTPNNEAVLAEPVQIKVRWINRQTQVAGPEGTPITVNATAVVAQDIVIGSLMWHGTLEDFYGSGSAGDDAEIMEVVAAPKTPDLKRRNWRRTVGLRYYRSRLPGRE